MTNRNEHGDAGLAVAKRPLLVLFGLVAVTGLILWATNRGSDPADGSSDVPTTPIAADAGPPADRLPVDPVTVSPACASATADTTPSGVELAWVADIEPTRVLDTRESAVLSPGTCVELELAALVGAPPQVRGLALDLTVVNAVQPGHVTAYDCGYAAPNVSMLNTAPGRTDSAVSIVPAPSGRICISVESGGDLVVDAIGFFAPTGAGIAAADTPLALGTVDLTAGVDNVLTLNPAAVGASATIVLVTTDAGAPGTLTPCSSTTSLVDYPASSWHTVVIVPARSDGSLCVRASNEVSVDLQLLAWFTPDSDAVLFSDVKRFDGRATGTAAWTISNDDRPDMQFVIGTMTFISQSPEAGAITMDWGCVGAPIAVASTHPSGPTAHLFVGTSRPDRPLCIAADRAGVTVLDYTATR